MGVDCLIAYPTHKPPAHAGERLPGCARTFVQIETEGPKFSDGRGPDIVHAWTPREIVRIFSEKILSKYPCPLIVHMEDNEAYLTEVLTGRPFAELEKMTENDLNILIPESCYHPVKGRQFIKRAHGLTLISNNLHEYNFGRVPCQKIIPAPDGKLFYPRPVNYILRDHLGIPKNNIVIVYTGNVHEGNKDEVATLYKAVHLLNKTGRPANIIRTGINGKPMFDRDLSRMCRYEKNLGWVKRNKIAEILAAGDVLVQPGKPGRYNDMRVPSKLPEFFALGRPVILPASNLGLKIMHGKEAWVLNEMTPKSLAAAIIRIVDDSVLKKQLSEGALAFFERQFAKSNSEVCLNQFYSRILKYHDRHHHNGQRPIWLFVPYFKHRNEKRAKEIDAAFNLNHQNSHFSKIVAIVDDGSEPPINDDKVISVQVKTRPTYKLWLNLAQKYAPDAVSIFANADIYFDNSICQIATVLKEHKTVIALSRYEKVNGDTFPHPNPHWSQDAWAIKRPSELSPDFLSKLDIPVGVPRCDNKVAYYFAVHGWKIYNPFNFLSCFHLHDSQYRNYDKKKDVSLLGGVAYVHPSERLSEPSIVDIDIWAIRTKAIDKVSLNRSLDNWLERSERRTVSMSPCSHFQENYFTNIQSIPDKATQDYYQRNGNEIFSYNNRFYIYSHNNKAFCIDRLSPEKACVFNLSTVPLLPNESTKRSYVLMALFVPPVMDIQVKVTDRPLTPSDIQFWQYPAITEKQAYENHITLKCGSNIDRNNQIVHIYVGLPWATYIDKKKIPEIVIDDSCRKIKGMKKLVDSFGYDLKVHTVCQQIYWRRMLPHFKRLGITDLHLSHCVRDDLQVNIGNGLRIHSWPLFAVNVSDPDRARGITIGKSIKQKKYFAAFKGNQMPHYRSNIRERLFEVSKLLGGKDVMVELGDDWHFKNIVYKEQVACRSLGADESTAYLNECYIYNRILSDSVFSFCPEGAGPNTLRFWESLATGTIPVLLSDDWVLPAVTDGLDWEECIVRIQSFELLNTFNILRKFDTKRLAVLQKNCLNAYAYFENMSCWKPVSCDI